MRLLQNDRNENKNEQGLSEDLSFGMEKDVTDIDVLRENIEESWIQRGQLE